MKITITNKVNNYLKIGLSLHSLERYEKAIEMYALAIKLDNNKPDYYHQKGKL